MIDTKEASDVPTADRVAQLFHGSGAASESDSDSESEDEALEEIDFTDLAQVRAEVDAIAQGTVTTTTTDLTANAHEVEQAIEEVDFADLAAIRAKVDAAEPRVASREGAIEEIFTGIYNQIKDTTELSNTTTVDDNQPNAVQQAASSSTLPAHDDSNLLHSKPSIEIPNLSNAHESVAPDQETIVVEKEVPCSSNTSLDMPVEEPSLPAAPEIHHATVPTHDIPLHPDDNPHPLFVVDTTPSHPFPSMGRSASDVILVDRTGHGETLGDQDEERIVYVAPHPRSRRTSVSPIPGIPRVKLPRSSMLTGRSVEKEVGGLRSPVREDDVGLMGTDRVGEVMVEEEGGEAQYLSLASLTLGSTLSESNTPPTGPSNANAARKARKKAVRIQRQRQRQNKRGRLGFGAYGAMVSEAQLREEDVRDRRGPKWETRRRGDSDVDWGTDDEGDGEEKGDGVDEVDALSDGLGGMEIDPDLEMDVAAMQGFVKSMSAEGSRFVTVDDIEDEARMRLVDEEGQGGPDGSSDSEGSDEDDEVDEEGEEEVFNIEEEILIAESDGDEELSEDSDDDELSPRSSFHAQLRKMRERSRGQRPKSVQEISDDEDEEAPEFPPWTRSANDEAFIARINVSHALPLVVSGLMQTRLGPDRRKQSDSFWP